jgi:hypothetical protein
MKSRLLVPLAYAPRSAGPAAELAPVTRFMLERAIMVARWTPQTKRRFTLDEREGHRAVPQ